ncbi:MAG: acyltransferase [Deltaproteobacteria bacterium]|nr:acyltransferase [Deltaproteobacteria bacterium]
MKPIVSPNIRLRCPDAFVIGEGSIIDDYCYFSTRLEIGRYTHIANNCSAAGGRERLFRVGDYCSLSAGVRIWCTSDDFVNDVVALPPPGMVDPKDHLISADVSLANFTAVGCNSVVMPGNRIPEGTVIGAMSYVPPFAELLPWHVYAGVPARPIRPRNRANVERQVAEMEAFVRGRSPSE